MKTQKHILQKLAIVVLISTLGFLIYIYLSNPYLKLMKVSGNSEENYYPYVRLIIAFLLSISLLFSFLKKYKIYHFLHLLWLVPIIWGLLKLFFGIYNTEKTDFYLSTPISKNYTIHQYESKGWLINEIRVKSHNKIDTIYTSVNPTWQNEKKNKAKDNNKLKIFRSFITGYYYVSISE